jgi:hypothetical protein
MTKPDVAFLVFAPLKQRREDNSFDGNDNIGAKVIEDVLTRRGIAVTHCSPESAHKYRLVLVSFTSTYDVFAFYKAVALLPSWQPGKRVFKVLAGGFGMQNPTTIRHYVDYAAFGRAEEWVAPVVDAILGGGEPTAHESLMHLPDLHPVKIAQPSQLYPFEVAGWQETFTGCPLKCKFCHYTYARKHQGGDDAYGQYVQTSLTGGGTPELTWDQLFTWGRKLGRVRVAIDGFSERLRYIYGKRIGGDDIAAGLEAIGERVHNVVVPVDAEFSFNDVLGGPVTQSAGWQMALTIFEGVNLREAPGGGICQASTTVYRAALNAGLPIVEQKSHSLYVTYYEAYGVGQDATVFPGKQNLRFRNDTGAPLLLQSYYEGDDAYVHILGRPDGRQVTVDGPYFGSTAPADVQVNGRAVRGNEIVWVRTITSAEGAQTKEVLVSRYNAVPKSLVAKWPATSQTTLHAAAALVANQR